MDYSLTYTEREGSGPAALCIRPAAVAVAEGEQRMSTHFIALIDISDSMADSNKLAHVKHCMSLLLQFLTPADRLSLVTFGEDSKIVLRGVKADGAAAAAAAAAIAELHTDGCTNLSAGLAAVCQILEGGLDTGGCAATAMKPALLILTDGHANRGASRPDELLSIIKTMGDRFPALSFSFIAYGTEHNANLLQQMSAQQMGPYSVVENIESAALAMGEALGGACSCCAQNVLVRCPAGTKALNPYKATPEGVIRIGDLYSGSEVLLLLELEAGPVIVEGVSLPDMISFRNELIPTFDSTPSPEIELARLRVTCSELFRRIREGATDLPALQREVTAFEEAVRATAYDGHPVAEMLRQEVVSLRAALVMVGRRGVDRELTTHIAAHEQYTLLGRGASQPIQVRAVSPVRMWSAAPRAMWSAGPSVSDDENPVGITTMPPPTSYLSPTSSQTARRIATRMQVLSVAASQPAEEEDVN